MRKPSGRRTKPTLAHDSLTQPQCGAHRVVRVSARVATPIGHGAGTVAALAESRVPVSFAPMGLRVVVAEDDLLVREGLVRLLSTAPDIEVVAACCDYDALVAAVEQEDPDVVLTDIRMPPTSTDEGIRVAKQLHRTHPNIGIVIVSQYSEPELVLGLFEDGSDRRAYLLKERIRDRSVLVSAIRSVAAGGSSIDPKIVDVLVFLRSGGESTRLDSLTPREREVLAAIAQGKSNPVIAEELFLTTRSVEKHVNSIFLKLDLAHADDVSKRVKAALIFLAETHSSPRA